MNNNGSGGVHEIRITGVEFAGDAEWLSQPVSKLPKNSERIAFHGVVQEVAKMLTSDRRMACVTIGGMPAGGESSDGTLVIGGVVEETMLTLVRGSQSVWEHHFNGFKHPGFKWVGYMHRCAKDVLDHHAQNGVIPFEPSAATYILATAQFNEADMKLIATLGGFALRSVEPFDQSPRRFLVPHRSSHQLYHHK